jgi:Fe-S oxidoreductase
MSIEPRNKCIFNEEACTRCGECFHKCPELQLPIEEAQKEIEGLISGKGGEQILSFCTTCLSCNLYCPNDCKPYQLILERWNDLYNRRGAPPIYRFVCPTIDSNIWHILYSLMNEDERKTIRNWMRKKASDTVLLVGNYVHLFPFIISGSKILDYFTVLDLLYHWECGAYLYQGGYLDIVKQIAEDCKKDFIDWNVNTIVPMLDAVEWMLTGVYSQEMNVDHDFRVLNFHDWLLSKVDSDEISLTRKLGMKVTVQDNCYSKVDGGKYWDAPRQLLQKAGCQIIEMEHNKGDSLCCGFGSGASWTKPFSVAFDILTVTKRKLEEAEATGADALVSYCGGCLYLLWAAHELLGSQIDVYHIVEIIRMSMGEQINHPKANIERAWDIIAIVTYHLILSLFGKPFKIQETQMKKNQWKKKRFTFLLVIRKLFDFGFIRNVYRRLFQLILPKFSSIKHH